MQYTITEAAKTDLPDIVEIYNSTIAARQSTADLTPVSIAEREPWFDAHGGKRPLYVLKNHEGTVLAWCSLSDYYPRHAYHISSEISLYVRHDARGIGVGKILLQNVLERAPSLGIKNIIGSHLRTQLPQPAPVSPVRLYGMGAIARRMRLRNAASRCCHLRQKISRLNPRQPNRKPFQTLPAPNQNDRSPNLPLLFRTSLQRLLCPIPPPRKPAANRRTADAFQIQRLCFARYRLYR